MAVEVEGRVETMAVLPAANGASSKPSKAKQVKFQEPAEEIKKKQKKPSSHPPYLQMVKEAISSLQERSGSSQHAIAKYLEDKYDKDLPATFKRMLSIQLKNMSNNGKLTKVKNSFKLAPKRVRKASVVVVPGQAAAADEKQTKLQKVVRSSKPGAAPAMPKKRPAAAAAGKPRKKAKSAATAVASSAKAASIKEAAERDLRAALRAKRQQQSAAKASPAKPKKALATAKRAKRVSAL